MKLYKLHPNGVHSLKNEYEAYEYTDKIKLEQTVDSLDGFTNVYFIPSTEFPRVDFKKYYPKINVRRTLKNIDCVIFDDSTQSPKSENFYKYYNSPRVYVGNNDTLYFDEYIAYYSGGGVYEDIRTSHTSANLPIFTGDLIKVSDYNKYSKIINDGIPCIHINSVFKDFTTEVRESDVDLNDAYKYFREVQTNDKSTAQSALDIIAALDPNKYLPLQSLILSVFKVNPNVLLRNITSKRFKTFNRFMSDKSFGYKNPANSTLPWHYRTYTDTTPLYNLNAFISFIDRSDHFTSEMEYDTALFCLTKSMVPNLNYDHVVLTAGFDHIKSDKILSSEILHVEPLEEVKKEVSTNEIHWGL
jgi:hypothetical protein